MERQVRGEKRRERWRARWKGAKKVGRMVKMRKVGWVGRSGRYNKWKGKE